MERKERKAGQRTPKAADLAAALNPLRAASRPPVRAPLVMAFHGSSFCRIAIIEQSMAENMPPHTAKLPGERKRAT